MTPHDSPTQETSHDPSDPTPTSDKSSATEYIVIAALILVVLIGAITLMGERTSGIPEPPPTAQPAP